MTHIPESQFQTEVEVWFREQFPEADIKRGYDTALPNTGRYPDLLVEGSFLGDMVVEVENDFEACYKGVGQALTYAAETGYTPVLVTPEGHIEQPEWSYMRQFVLGITVPTKEK